MLTRRSFLGTVAAVAMSPQASKAAPVAAPIAAPLSQGVFIAAMEADIRAAMLKMKRDLIHDMYADEFTRAPRRDDGDTILELR